MQRTLSGVGTKSRGEHLFRSRLKEIERIISWVASRVGLVGQEVEDFASYSKTRLIENDYAVLEKFQGKSKFSTYMNVVIRNQARDWIIQKTGKWRPSRKAQRLGQVAIALERLMGREKVAFEEAVGILTTRFGSQVSREEIERLRAELPHDRFSRSFEGLEALEEAASTEISGEERLLLKERHKQRQQAEAALKQCIGALRDEDQLILKMRYWDGLRVNQIAQTLGLEVKPLYRRIERLRKRLEECLIRAGIEGTANIL